MAPPRPPRPVSADTLGRSEAGDTERPLSAALPSQNQSMLLVPSADDGFKFPSPNPSRPATAVSIASTSSRYSTGEEGHAPEIPHFPEELANSIQQDARFSQQPSSQLAPQQARNRIPLGPPPSARRGPASYYSQNQPVDPIEEEMDSPRGSSLRESRDPRISYASSNAIATGMPGYLKAPAVKPAPIAKSAGEDMLNLPQHSLATLPALHERQRSADSQTSPSVVNQSTDRPPDIKTSPPRKPVANARPPIITHNSTNTTRTGSSGTLGRYASSFYPRESVDYEKAPPLPPALPPGTYNVQGANAQGPPNSRGRAYDTSGSGYGDPRVESILHRLEKGGALGSSSNSIESTSPITPLSERQGRFPFRTQNSATRPTTRGTDGRSSMTSLPGLILRATTLASKLDRHENGRSSRPTTNWGDFDKKNAGWRRQSTFSDAFPPSAYPSDVGHGRTGSRISSRFPFVARSHNNMPANDYHNGYGGPVQREQSHDKVLGMKKQTLYIALAILLVIVLAAIIIPVAAVLIPKQNEKQSVTVSGCQMSLPCSNGGVSIVGSEGTQCQCLCVNGYTGKTCTGGLGTACSGIDLAQAANATVGSAIPRLLSGASTNYSIQLQAPTILGLFAVTNLTCASENALMTFNGLMTRDIKDEDESLENPDKTLEARQDSMDGSASTANGIVFAQSTPSASPVSSSSSSSSSSNQNSGLQSSSSGSSAGGSSAITAPGVINNTRALDFARVAVLFVLQDSNELNYAIVAQQSLQSYLASGKTSSASNVTVGNGYSVNFSQGMIQSGNGTLVGGGTAM